MNRRRRYQAATPRSHWQRVEDNAFHLNASNSSALAARWAGRVGLPSQLEMFFSQRSHAEVLEPAAEHPMEKGVIGGESVGLSLVRIGFFTLARSKRRSGKLVVGQCQLGVALHG